MPNNIFPQDSGSEIRALHARLAKLENSPQVGHQSILDGSLNILDSQGRVLMVLGNQPDGSVGIASYNPATGVKLTQMGQLPTGLYGMAVLNQATSQFQLVSGTTSASSAAAESTSSTTFVTFGDDPSVSVVIGSSGQALVAFGSTIGMGGDSDSGVCALTADGVATAVTDRLSVSGGSVNVGVQATCSRTTIVSGLSAGTHTFSLQYRCVNGLHGATFTTRYVTVSPI